ncbi:MAG TPA: polysaccharide deacetylase family protein [Bryobacteraceae bacterium]|nr:polysaccharide deacetylase family protein [Bryobacteraceae bacterium]
MPFTTEPIIDTILGGPHPVKAKVYLTFDDGPYPATEEVLNVLRTAEVKATFFLTWKHLSHDSALQYRLIRRMLNEGHSLGNHGEDHDPQGASGYQSTTPGAVKKDFTGNLEKLKALFEANKDTFPGFDVARLPGDGRFQPSYVKMITEDLRLPHAGWDFELGDMRFLKDKKTKVGRMSHLNQLNWQEIQGVAATERGLPNPGSVILLHDNHWSGKSDILLKLITKLKQHFTIAPLSPVPYAPTSIQRPK